MPRALLLLLATACAWAGGLRVSPDTAHLSLGYGSVGTATYLLENTSSEELALPLVVTLCECSFARLSRSPIPPGDTATLTLLYDTSLKPLPKESSSYDTGARLYPSDQSSFVPVFLEVEITNLFRYLPFPAVAFRNLHPGEAAETRLTVFRDGAPGIVEAVATEPWLRPVLQEAEVEGEAAVELVVSLDPAAPTGRLSGAVRLTTEHPAQPLIELPVVGRNDGSLRCEDRLQRFVAGDTTSFGYAGTGDAVPAIVDLTAPPWLRVWSEPGRIFLTTDDDFSGVTSGGELVVLFDDPHTPAVRVPVLATRPGGEEDLEALKELGFRFDPVSGALSIATHQRGKFPLERHLELFRAGDGPVVEDLRLAGLDSLLKPRTRLSDRRATLVVEHGDDGLLSGFFATDCLVTVDGRDYALPVFGAVEPRVEAVPPGLVFDAPGAERVLFLRGIGAREAGLELGALALVSDEVLPGGRRLVLRAPATGQRGALYAGGTRVPIVCGY